MDRRRYLMTVGSSLFALAGCVDGDSSQERVESQSVETPAETPTETPPPTSTPTPIHEDYETTEIRVFSSNGWELGSVTAAIADTSDLRYLGLSDTESLPEDRGMLFVFDSVGNHTFVMRRMDFGIDIVYADSDGTITKIHHAPAPEPGEDGNDQDYPGEGQYVLEVNYGWTTDHDVSEGDRLAFELA
jgi:uncharacterized membrane protein (UPF0127 family)